VIGAFLSFRAVLSPSDDGEDQVQDASQRPALNQVTGRPQHSYNGEFLTHKQFVLVASSNPMNRAQRFILHSCEAVYGGIMANHRFALSVAPFVRMECKFWISDDGWNGSCDQLSITVQAGSFERVKSEMEVALGKYMESLLAEAQPTKIAQAA
jgi:hypothetical protein